VGAQGQAKRRARDRVKERIFIFIFGGKENGGEKAVPRGVRFGVVARVRG
jgi:hypothetical protein